MGAQPGRLRIAGGASPRTELGALLGEEHPIAGLALEMGATAAFKATCAGIGAKV